MSGHHDPVSPERASADVRTTPVVVASTDVDTSQEVTFAAFTDPAVYSRWLGVPVTLRDGYLRIQPRASGSHVEVHQLVAPPAPNSAHPRTRFMIVSG